MEKKPTYKELEQMVKELEKEAAKRKQAEEALRRSEQEIRVIADNVPTLFSKEKDGTLELTVIDNGKGITKKQMSDPQSFGLMGIRERVHPWGGEVNIKGSPGEGTTVIVNIALNEKGL